MALWETTALRLVAAAVHDCAGFWDHPHLDPRLEDDHDHVQDSSKGVMGVDWLDTPCIGLQVWLQGWHQ